jgi:hypothetical protein
MPSRAHGRRTPPATAATHPALVTAKGRLLLMSLLLQHAQQSITRLTFLTCEQVSILLAANKQWLIGPGMSLAAGALLTLLLLLLLFSTAGRVCHEPHALQPCCFRPKPPSSSNLRSSCAAAAAAAVAAAVRTMPAKTC